MKTGCPNKTCKNHKKTSSIIRDGVFKRKDDSRIIQRYKCKICGKRFSGATFNLAKGQHKRRVNNKLFELYCSGVSMNRCAKLLRINPKTVARKLDFLAKKCQRDNHKFRKKKTQDQVTHLQFDDLITIEHTKLKPLSVTLAIDANNRKILGFRVSVIPAFGHLAELSRKKYGRRKNEHKKKLVELFKEITPLVCSNALVQSDQHTFYSPVVRRFLPHAEHRQHKGGRGCVAGQGELKKLHFDPLFMLNHSCAMLRANINRLVRKTWCTTKSVERLRMHLELYMCYHNHYL
ncbi:MAG: hypothetical protein KDK96_12225 [Chlamydiia bacterium]|nr:hypothetical protein [Chlamydiia bacterium]